MKQFLYLADGGGTFQQYLVRSDGELIRGEVEAEKADFILLSRLTVDCVRMKLPRVRRVEALKMLRYRLPAVYPGNPSEVELSFVMQTSYAHKPANAANEALVFIIPKESLSRIRSLHGEKPLVLALSLLGENRAERGRAGRSGTPLSASGSRQVFLVYPDCIERVVLTGWRVSETEVTARDTAADPVALAAFRWGEEHVYSEPSRWYAFRTDLGTVKAGLVQYAHPGSTSGAVSEVLPFTELFKKSRIAHTAVFAHRRKRRFLSGALLVVLVLLAVTAAGGVKLFTNISERERYLDELKAQYRELEYAAQDSLAASQTLADLSKAVSQMDEAVPPDLYRFLSLLTSTLGAGVEIESLTLRGRNFELEGTALTPFALIDSFKTESTAFSGVSINRVTPEREGERERFSLRGEYRGK